MVVPSENANYKTKWFCESCINSWVLSLLSMFVKMVADNSYIHTRTYIKTLWFSYQYSIIRLMNKPQSVGVNFESLMFSVDLMEMSRFFSIHSRAFLIMSNLKNDFKRRFLSKFEAVGTSSFWFDNLGFSKGLWTSSKSETDPTVDYWFKLSRPM